MSDVQLRARVRGLSRQRGLRKLGYVYRRTTLLDWLTVEGHFTCRTEPRVLGVDLLTETSSDVFVFVRPAGSRSYGLPCTVKIVGFLSSQLLQVR